ncbi:SufD family Fe-S cluster assembly protein [Sulfurovum riftiae]|uniref:Fe-S cluster assembly protein SufD n=1 Tax=Sulfurovum riftiae TaxID=1630136 RepID=A0A151CID2_9BACT|nr:SufD family Fe-S cluster assembly protein [Sulfurovum riftiae]KYJ87295.1 Fe-S cluster assembly protein SufD [Sulfurovum riftiae]
MILDALRKKTVEEMGQALGVDARKPQLARLHALGLPTKKSEAYRYFDIDTLLAQEYTLLDYVPKSIQESDRVEIVDGTVISAPKGMRIFYEECKLIDMEHFDPLYYLGHLLAPHVIKIEIDGDAHVEIVHRFTKSNALINYRIALENQSNRHAIVYESFENEAISNSLVLYGYDMHIAPDSTLRVLKTQTFDAEHYAIVASHSIHVERQANAILKSFDFGGGLGLQLIKVVLEERAHTEMGHLLYLNSDSRRGTVSQIIHRGQHSTSSQEAKNILDGHSRGIFDALIKVEHSAKYTKAHQNSKAILLDEKAYMVAKPQLEIYIDELEASHGSTTGQLDKKQLFYLQSRGISAVEARKMLVIAFANTLIEKVKDIRQQERIKDEFENAFYAMQEKETAGEAS